MNGGQGAASGGAASGGGAGGGGASGGAASGGGAGGGGAGGGGAGGGYFPGMRSLSDGSPLRQLAERVADRHCTHGGDCQVHPSAGGLHDFSEVRMNNALSATPPSGHDRATAERVLSELSIAAQAGELGEDGIRWLIDEAAYLGAILSEVRP